MKTQILVLIAAAFYFSTPLHAESVGSGSSDDDIITGTVVTGPDPIPTFDAQKGTTPEFGHCYHFKKMGFNAATWIEKDLQDAKWPKPIQIDGEKISQEEWIEIDSCTRTMMSEIGTEPACRVDGKWDDYATALARIIANRSNYMSTHANKKEDPIAAVLYPMKSAMEDKHQFSVWNAGAKVVDGAPCPSKNGANAPTWNNYLGLCKTAVLEGGRRIKVRTPAMTDDMLYYTSGCKMHYARLCQGYTPLKAQIGSTTIQNSKCFEMWKDNHTKLSNKQMMTCSQKASACCTPPSEGDHVIADKRNNCDSGVSSWSKAVGI